MVQTATESGEDAGSIETKPVSHMSHSLKLQPLHDDIKPEETPGVPSVDVGAGKTIAVLAEEAAKRKAEKDNEDQAAVEGDEIPAAEPTTTSEAPTGPPAVKTTKITIGKPDEAETTEAADEPAPEETEVEEKAAESDEKPAEASAEPNEPEPESKADKSDDLAEEKSEDKPAEPSEPELKLGEDAPAADETGDTNLSEADQRKELAAQKQAEAQEKIIASGKYYLPIDAVAHRRTKRHIVVGLVLILVLAAALFLAAWDAGFFSIPGYTAPTDYL